MGDPSRDKTPTKSCEKFKTLPLTGTPKTQEIDEFQYD